MGKFVGEPIEGDWRHDGQGDGSTNGPCGGVLLVAAAGLHVAWQNNRVTNDDDIELLDEHLSLRRAAAADAPWIAELRAAVMRPDLERLGRYDPVRVRQRFLDAFEPHVTTVICVAGNTAGVIAARPVADAVWIEHFYLSAAHQGQGIGDAVLRQTLAMDTHGRPFKLNVLCGSAARRLYERHGFVVDTEDDVDVFMSRPAGSRQTPARP